MELNAKQGMSAAAGTGTLWLGTPPTGTPHWQPGGRGGGDRGRSLTLMLRDFFGLGGDLSSCQGHCGGKGHGERRR